MDAVCKIEDLNSAGVLYFSLLEQMIKSNKKLSEEEIEEKIKANFKMKGLIVADINIVKMHDKNLEKGSSNLIPAYIDKSGFHIFYTTSHRDIWTSLDISETSTSINYVFFYGVLYYVLFHENNKLIKLISIFILIPSSFYCVALGERTNVWTSMGVAY